MSENNDGKIVAFMILALIAFGIGSGIGISMGLSGDDLSSLNSTDNNTTHVENVTVEMTSNLDDNPSYINLTNESTNDSLSDY